MAALTPPNLLDGRYELLEPLGRGGMAQVVRGWDRRLRRDVAVKFLAPHLSQDPGTGERFRQEITALAQLDHPNIVTIFDTGEGADGRLYLVMERLQGETLDQTLAALRGRDEPLAWPRLSAIGRQLCAALQAAHGRGIVHRDVKPSNIFRLSVDGNRDFIKLVDFGIVKVIAENFGGEREASLTEMGTFIGTPHYAAPEMIAPERHGRPDARADIFSLGVVLYECATGGLPFEGLPKVAVLARTAMEPLPPPRSAKREIPRALETIIVRATALAPQDRFASAREFGAALAMFEASIAGTSGSISIGPPQGEWRIPTGVRRSPPPPPRPSPPRSASPDVSPPVRGTRMLGSRNVGEISPPAATPPAEIEVVHGVLEQAPVAIAAPSVDPSAPLPPEAIETPPPDLSEELDENVSTPGHTPLPADDAILTAPVVAAAEEKGGVSRAALILAVALAGIVIAAWAWMPDAVEDGRTKKTVIHMDSAAKQPTEAPTKEPEQDAPKPERDVKRPEPEAKNPEGPPTRESSPPVELPDPSEGGMPPPPEVPETSPEGLGDEPQPPPNSPQKTKVGPTPDVLTDPKVVAACERELADLFESKRNAMMSCLSQSGVFLGLKAPDLRVRLRTTDRRVPKVDVVRPSTQVKPAVRCIEGVYADATLECKTAAIDVLRTL